MEESRVHVEVLYQRRDPAVGQARNEPGARIGKNIGDNGRDLSGGAPGVCLDIHARAYPSLRCWNSEAL
jgi:hypothetical protein